MTASTYEAWCVSQIELGSLRLLPQLTGSRSSFAQVSPPSPQEFAPTSHPAAVHSPASHLFLLESVPRMGTLGCYKDPHSCVGSQGQNKQDKENHPYPPLFQVSIVHPLLTRNQPTRTNDERTQAPLFKAAPSIVAASGNNQAPPANDWVGITPASVHCKVTQPGRVVRQWTLSPHE